MWATRRTRDVYKCETQECVGSGKAPLLENREKWGTHSIPRLDVGRPFYSRLDVGHDAEVDNGGFMLISTGLAEDILGGINEAEDSQGSHSKDEYLNKLRANHHAWRGVASASAGCESVSDHGAA
jgi:hypothetical protein